MEFLSINDYKQFDDKRFTKIDMIKDPRSVAFMLNFLPGQHMKPHGHPGKELYLLVTDGSGTFIVDDEEIEASVGDVLYCRPEEQIGFTNTGEERVTIYVTMTKIS